MIKKIFFIIDTSRKNTLRLALGNEKNLLCFRIHETTLHDSENILKNIMRLCKEEKISFAEWRGIIVSVGPGGSFTATRLGVVIANTLAWSLHIPNVGIETKREKTLEEIYEDGKKKIAKTKKPKILLPNYGREPNITKKK